MNKHIEELHKIREENAKKKKGMSIKEKLDYMIKEAESTHKNLNSKAELSDYSISKKDLSNSIIMEETSEYNSDEKI